MNIVAIIEVKLFLIITEINYLCYIDKQMFHCNVLTYMTAELGLQNYVLWML